MSKESKIVGLYEAGKIKVLRGQHPVDTLFTLLHEAGHAFDAKFSGKKLNKPKQIAASAAPAEVVTGLLSIIYERKGDAALLPLVHPILQIIASVNTDSLIQKTYFITDRQMQADIKFDADYADIVEYLFGEIADLADPSEVAAYWFEIAGAQIIQQIPGLNFDWNKFDEPDNPDFQEALRLFKANLRFETTLG